MRLEFWAAQGVPALIAMDTHAGVGLYHVISSIALSGWWGDPVRRGCWQARHRRTGESRARGLCRSDRGVGVAAFVAVCPGEYESRFAPESPALRGEAFLPRSQRD